MRPLPLSRRHFVRSCSLMLPALAFAPRELWAQDTESVPAPPPILAQGRGKVASAKLELTPLRGGVRALEGAGCNIAVLPGMDGTLLVDTGYRTAQPQITTLLQGVSPDPIRHLINTHWHFDHTDGNAWMHAGGASILARDTCRTRLSTPQRIEFMHATVPALPAGALPEQTFAATQTLHLNGATLRLQTYAPAHTDTDISIYFTEADVLHVGDTWFNGFYPFIDYSTGGSINGVIAATERNLALATGSTVIIPGHGPVGTRTQLAEYRDVLVYARDRVAALKKQGRSLPEIVAAKPTAKYDAQWAAALTPEQFLGLVYEGV